MISAQKQKQNKMRIERNRTIEQNSCQNDNYLMYMRKKYKKSKERKTTHSVCSIDAKKSSINSVYQPSIRKRRKLLSIPSIDAQNIYTERPQQEQTYNCRQNDSVIVFDEAKSRRRVKTIEQHELDIKQKKIKNCIQLMQGVLKEIQEQKSVGHAKKKKTIEELQNKQTITYNPNDHKKENQESNFENFLKKIPQSKQDSKPIILKRAKSRSIINICDSAKDIATGKFKKLPKQNKQSLNISNIKLRHQALSKENRTKHKIFDQKQTEKSQILQSIECSTIYNANQSSFISNNGKMELIQHMSNQKQRQECREKETIQINKKNIKISNRKLKNNFPFDFF